VNVKILLLILIKFITNFLKYLDITQFSFNKIRDHEDKYLKMFLYLIFNFKYEGEVKC